MENIEKEPLLEKAKSLSGSPFAAPLIIAEIEKSKTTDYQIITSIFKKANIYIDKLYLIFSTDCKQIGKSFVIDDSHKRVEFVFDNNENLIDVK